MEIKQNENDYARLFINLKEAVEGVLGCNSANIWDVYGVSLHKLHLYMTEILKHGFRFLKINGEPDLWVFIQGLTWLQPALAASPSFLGYHFSSARSPPKIYDKAKMWLCRSVENRTLSEKLSWLLSDQEHLLSCYTATAYLRQNKFSEATLICLRAYEQRKLSLLAKIDPSLFLKPAITNKTHRRCLSYPKPNISEKNWSVYDNTNQTDHKLSVENSTITENVPKVEKIDGISINNEPSSSSNLRKNIINSIFKCNVEEKSIKTLIKEKLLKKSFSCSDLYLMHYKDKASVLFLRKISSLSHTRKRCYSESSHTQSEDYLSNETNTQLYSDLLRVRYDKLDENTKQDSGIEDKEEHVDWPYMTNVNSNKSKNKHRRKRPTFLKLPFRIWEESDDDRSMCSDDSKTLIFQSAITESNKARRKSFIEKGGNIALPMSFGNFPKPSPGQSIMSFLLSGVFTQTNAKLDRENAHFNISEAMIAALEQVKCNQQLRSSDEIFEESDEDMLKCKQQKRKHADEFFFSETTDTTATTDQSVNSLSSSVYSTSDSISTDVDDQEFSESNLLPTQNSGLSVSKLSLYDEQYSNLNNKCNMSASAENVAISLLKRFKQDQLPAASDIKWLVSERDAPQQILPLPNYFHLNEEQEKTFAENRLRGTSEWAPPRPQIIFTPHPSPVYEERRQLMEKQGYRCAGCGTKVTQKYASKFRYCEYLGRYFCSSCHSQQSALVPGRILSKWDFNKYQVSNFSFELLDQMATDPLYNVIDLNPTLYHRVKELNKIRLLRVSLFYLKDFIFSCKFAGKCQAMIKSEPSYVYADPHCYSLVDFIRVKNGKFFKTLSDLIKTCENHIHQCQLCQARGFYCEICKLKETIFPWELNKIIRCGKCGSCYHIKCYASKQVCPRCVRIDNRNDLRKIGLRNYVSV